MAYRDYHPRRTAFRTLRALLGLVLVLVLAGAGSVLMAAAPSDAAPAADWFTKSGADAALRHTRLTRSSPARDTSLSGPPAAITLWFTKPVQLKLTRLMLKDSRGVVVVLHAPAFVDASQTSVAASLRGTAAPGAYTVTWVTTSRDSHVIKGSFGFRITAALGARM